MNRQLSLNVRLRDDSSFENFLADRNEEPVQQLLAIVRAACRKETLPEGMLFLWGERGSGKTHLLQAACRLVQELGRVPVYIPLDCADQLSPMLLEGLEHVSLVCLDDAQAIAREPVWETALVGLYERLMRSCVPLIVAGRQGPAGLGLPDLATRLGAGLVYRLHALDDRQKLAAMRLRASNRGLEMSDEVARYVLRRYPRDMQSLFAWLDRIDQASLSSQRRITIPFVRSLEGC